MGLLRGRRGLLLLAAMAALGSGGCETAVGLDAEDGFDAVWAGKPWEGDASAAVIPGGAAGDTLYLFGTTPRNAGQMPAAYVRVRVPLPAAGERALARGDAELVYLVGGDVSTAAYVNDRADPGILSIREYGDGWVSGVVVFDAGAAMEHRPVGGGARFEGNFRARVRSRP